MQRLLGLQVAEFEKAALYQRFMFWAQVAIAGLSIAAIFLNEPWSYFTGVGALVMAIALAWFWWKYQESRGQAERSRRATLVFGALGQPLSHEVLGDLETGFTVSAEAGRKRENPNYYSATAQHGYNRLIEMLDESAFWSADLMAQSALRTWGWFAFYLVLAIVLLLVPNVLGPAPQVEPINRVIVPILTLLVSANGLGMAIAYTLGAINLRHLQSRLVIARARGSQAADALLLLSDYNSTVEGAPMFLPGLYKRRNAQLNELWAERKRRAG